MKVEKNYYVIMKICNIEINNKTEFATDCYCSRFTEDIDSALKFGSKTAALYAKQDYEIRNKCYESGLDIVPVKMTYEW